MDSNQGNRSLVFENNRFFVFLDRVVSSVESVRDYLVVAPKRVAADLVTGLAVLPVVEGKVGLIKTYRHAIMGDSWEIPRGFVDSGQTVLDSALRE